MHVWDLTEGEQAGGGQKEGDNGGENGRGKSGGEGGTLQIRLSSPLEPMKGPSQCTLETLTCTECTWPFAHRHPAVFQITLFMKLLTILTMLPLAFFISPTLSEALSMLSISSPFSHSFTHA